MIRPLAAACAVTLLMLWRLVIPTDASAPAAPPIPGIAAACLPPCPVLDPGLIPADTEIVLAAVGDIMLARSVGRALERNGAASPFAAVVDYLANADVTVGNLECAVAASGQPQRKSYTFRAPPVAAQVLAAAGFDVVSMANNHAMDYGADALLESLALLGAAGVRVVGAGADAEAAHRPAILDVRGLRLAFLAYVNVPVEYGGFDTRRWEAGEDRPGLAWGSAAAIERDVAQARRQADLVIVLLHSGYEGRTAPNRVQQELARAAIDAGAALVIGSHPHVLQGMERYGRGWIAYSLGNFVFDGFSGISNQSAILRVTLDRQGVRRIEWIPVVIRSGRPQPATPPVREEILRRIERLSQVH